MRSWNLPLSFTRPPLSLNDRGHWAKKAAAVAAVRKEAAYRARATVPRNLGHITTRLHYLPPDNRRRDEDNLVATAKACWDGLVDAGIVPDDTSEYMTKIMPRIHHHEKGEKPRMWLEITTTGSEDTSAADK